MVFFFLKDKHRIRQWGAGFLPKKRNLAITVWHDVDRQIGNYVRGKVIEILIVWLSTFICFSVLGLNFAMLLSDQQDDVDALTQTVNNFNPTGVIGDIQQDIENLDVRTRIVENMYLDASVNALDISMV